MSDHVLKTLAAEMESVGRNCEFGLVQRALGLEPISLLRWAGSGIDSLIDGLRNRFRDLAEEMTGEPMPAWESPDKQHWWLTCKRYSIVFHTDQVVEHTTVDQATAAVRKRLRRLADKLLEDIANGEKLFVWSSAEMRSPLEALSLKAAMDDVGRGWLLSVAANPAEESTTHLLMAGFIGAWAPMLTAFSNAGGLQVEPWKRIIRVSHTIWQRERDRGPRPSIARAGGQATAAPAVVAAKDWMSCPKSELYSYFESLGNNCEFGIVQRRAGYDQPGLFRNVGYHNIQQIIEATLVDFEPMFEAETFSYHRRDGWPDWVLHCDRFGFVFHSGIPVDIGWSDPDWQRLSKKNIDSFRFMKRKIQGDIAAGEKIFVVRFKDTPDESLIDRLLAAVRLRGDGWLLHVHEDDTVPSGTVRFVKDGLLKAAVGWLSNENPPQIDFDSWERIARNALAIRHGARGIPANWRSPHAYSRLMPGVEASRHGLDVLEHATCPQNGREAIFHYYFPDMRPGAVCTATCSILIPDDFAGHEVCLVMVGYRSTAWRKADLTIRGKWQELFVTAEVPEGRSGLAPGLVALGAGRLYSCDWRIEQAPPG